MTSKEILTIKSGDFEKLANRERIVDLIIHCGNKRIYEINMYSLDASSYIMDTHAMLKSRNIIYSNSEY